MPIGIRFSVEQPNEICFSQMSNRVQNLKLENIVYNPTVAQEPNSQPLPLHLHTRRINTTNETRLVEWYSKREEQYRLHRTLMCR